MARTTRADPDRLLVRGGWKHYRRTYSLSEVRWGFATFVVIGAIVAWVVWRGQHPDPSLYSATPIAEAGAASIEPSTERGPVPAGLAAKDWTEGPITRFSAQNLYVKINGRADFFLSKGFEQLYFVSLASGEHTVDIELYDMAEPANAVGALSAERRAGTDVDTDSGMMSYASRNALFVARGPYYVRAIGSSESDAVSAQLDHLRSALASGLAGADRPWAYDLFVDAVGLDAANVSYKTQTAFSFEFGRDVYIGDLGGDTVGFVVAKESAEEAAESAAEYVEGFASIGERDGDYVKDSFIDTYSIVVAQDRFVVGIKGAPDKDAAAAALARMRDGLDKLSPQTLERAQPAAAPDTEPGATDE